LTGVTFFTITLGPKRLELLRELLPKAGKIAMLVNPRSLNPDAKEVQEAARALGQSVHVLSGQRGGCRHSVPIAGTRARRRPHRRLRSAVHQPT